MYEVRIYYGAVYMFISNALAVSHRNIFGRRIFPKHITVMLMEVVFPIWKTWGRYQWGDSPNVRIVLISPKTAYQS